MVLKEKRERGRERGRECIGSERHKDQLRFVQRIVGTQPSVCQNEQMCILESCILTIDSIPAEAGNTGCDKGFSGILALIGRVCRGPISLYYTISDQALQVNDLSQLAQRLAEMYAVQEQAIQGMQMSRYLLYLPNQCIHALAQVQETLRGVIRDVRPPVPSQRQLF